MNETQVIDVARDGVMTMLLLGGPVMMVGLVVGLVVSLFQTLTSLQEQTLTFVPKVIVVFGAVIFFLPFMISRLTDFTHEVMDIVVSLP